MKKVLYITLGVMLSISILTGCKADKQSQKDQNTKTETTKSAKSKATSKAKNKAPKEYALDEEDLKRIEEDMSHMEYNPLLGIEFNDREEIDWDKVYEDQNFEEYKPVSYTCVSGKNLASTYSVIMEPDLENDTPDKRIENPSRNLLMTCNGRKYTILSNKFQWDKGCSESIDIKLRQYQGECKLIAFYGNDEHSTHLFITEDGKKVAEFSSFIDVAGGSYEIKNIKDIAVTDYNKDCLSDIIMVCDTDDGEHVAIETGRVGYYGDFFYGEEELVNEVESCLDGKYTVAGIKDYILLHNTDDIEYKSYKEAYADLVDKAEADNESTGSYLYNLVKVNGDSTPELVLQKDDSQFVYTYEKGQLALFESEDIQKLDVKYNYGQILEKLGCAKDKITKLADAMPDENSNKIEFTAGGIDYTFEYNLHRLGRAQITLAKGEDSITQKDMTDINRVYLIERSNGQVFLLFNTCNDLYQSHIYVYNLNTDRLLPPTQFKSMFSVFNGDIKDTRSFDLMRVQMILGVAATYQNFFIGMDGLPKTNDAFETYISNSSLKDGNKIIKNGEVVKLKNATTFSVGKSPDDEDSWKDEELPAGTEMTLFQTDGDIVIMKLKDGRYTNLKVYSSEEEAKDDASEDDVPYIEDVFENIPMLVDEDHICYLLSDLERTLGVE